MSPVARAVTEETKHRGTSSRLRVIPASVQHETVPFPVSTGAFHPKRACATCIFTGMTFRKRTRISSKVRKWNLIEGAVPKIFPNLPPYLSKPPARRRKLPCRDQVVAQTSSAKKAKTSASAVAEESAADLDVPAASSKLTLREMEEVCLPSTNWRKTVGRDDDGSYVAFFVQKVEGKMLFVEKCVIIGEEGAVTVSTRGCIVKSCSRVNTIAQLAGLLQNECVCRLFKWFVRQRTERRKKY